MLTSYPPMRCGIGDHVHELAPYLVANGAKLRILTYDECEGAVGEIPGVQVERSLDRRGTPWALARTLRQALGQSDVLAWQSEMFLHPRAFQLAAPLLPRHAPLVPLVHDAPRSHRLFHVTPFLRALYHRADLLITHSAVTTATLVDHHHVDLTRIRQVPLGVDTDRFSPTKRSLDARRAAGWGDEDIVVLQLGFINRGKGIFTLLEAFHRALATRPHLRLVIAGDDVPPGVIGGTSSGDIAALRSRAAELGIAERVSFPGYVPDRDVPAWLASADVVALPYEFSYQSAALAKAMGAGACILATDIPSFSAWIHHEREALLVPVRDVTATADALGRLADDEGLRTRLKAAAAAEARRNHDMAEVAKRLVAVFEEARTSKR
ncbi:MAG: glycosyltransferase family 4 protein [Candidatus Thermoplasmatota archaeon]